MKLHIKDRLYILQILPGTGNFMEFATKRSIIEKVSISAEDKEKYKLNENTEENKLTWDSTIDAENPLEADFSQDELKFLRKSCEAVVDKTMPDEFWTTVEKLYNETQP